MTSGVRLNGYRGAKELSGTAVSKGTPPMKTLLIVIISVLLAPGLSYGGPALIYVPDRGDTGWQTYTYTAGPEGFSGTAGFVVSNVLDTSAYSELLLDNLKGAGEPTRASKQAILQDILLLMSCPR
jgi:hypothetical protein